MKTNNSVLDERVQKALYEACLVAARAMGSDLLKMSCYVSNWRKAS